MKKTIDISRGEYAEKMLDFMVDHKEIWEDYCQRQIPENLSIAEYVVKYVQKEFVEYILK